MSVAHRRSPHGVCVPPPPPARHTSGEPQRPSTALSGAPAPPHGRLENWESEGDVNYNTLVSAIENVDESNIVEDAFLVQYPLCHDVWNKYAMLEGHAGTDKVKEVYVRAVASAPYSVEIWVIYCQYLISSSESPDLIRRELERGLEYVGMNYNSNILWDVLINFEQCHKEWSRLANIYARISHHPIHQFHFYHKCFQDFVATHHLDIPTCQDLLTSTYTSFKNTDKLHQKVEFFEQAMKTKCFGFWPLTHEEIENYLDFMEKNGDIHQVCKLYERCLVVCASYSEFWARYVIYLRLNGKIELATDALHRATNVFVKKDMSIHLFHAWFKEYNGDVSEAREAYRYIYSKLCPSNVYAIVKLANIERRRRGKEHGCSIYENAIAEEKKRGQSKNLPSLMIEYARYLLTVCHDTMKGKEMLNIVLLECLTRQNLEDIMDLESKVPGTKHLELVAGAVQRFLETESTEQMSEMCDKEQISSTLIKFLQRFGGLQPELLNKAEMRHRRLFSCKGYPRLKRKAVDLGDEPRRTSEKALPPVVKDDHFTWSLLPTCDSLKVRSMNEQTLTLPVAKDDRSKPQVLSLLSTYDDDD